MAVVALALSTSASAAARIPAITIPTDVRAGPPLIGLGVEWDPYDNFRPTAADWQRTSQRLDFMRPAFLRVVEPASDYFAGYDSSHRPAYRWTSRHVRQLLAILGYAKSRHIAVVLGDWGNPMIGGDPRVPVEFIKQLRASYGYTNIRYYNLINEPNDQAGCDFSCWAEMVKKLASALKPVRGVELIGPDNANSWDDTAAAYRLDQTVGLDRDNPIGGDSWVTATLAAARRLIATYDSHRYATIWGIEHGIYGLQMRSRHEQIGNSVRPAKRYFEAEVGMTARQVSPFTAADMNPPPAWLAPFIDPSAHAGATPFVDSQPHIREFRYGVWMGDMMIQAISGGVSGASAWDLDDAMHVGGQYGSQNLKQWGFWNSYGGTDGYPASDLDPRPWYYAWSLMSRCFPAGSNPLATPSTGAVGVRVAAAKIKRGRRFGLSIAAVNDSDAQRVITLRLPSVHRRATLTRYDYSPDRLAAAPIRNARLARGVRVVLGAHSLIVLSTLKPVPLHEGTRELVDELDDWRKVASHTRGVRLDHGIPARFNDDRSRVLSTSKAPQNLVYRAHEISSFELKAYYRKRLELRAYRSGDGRRWTPIRLAFTTPAPALGGHGRYLVDVLPAVAMPPHTGHLKLVLLGKRTELGQVLIAHH